MKPKEPLEGYRSWLNRPGPSAATQLRLQLEHCRRDGLTFWEAWPLAMSRVTFTSVREQVRWFGVWDDDLVFMAWLDAYDGRTSPAGAAVGQLEGLAEAVAERPGEPLAPLAPADSRVRRGAVA